MATITTPVYLEDAARTAGEAMTINGGRLTVRTDTRWHANSPASMLGALGAVTISATLGGGYELNGTTVRWMAYDGGSGNVPAVGTTITGGTSGCTGYLLGVWASLTSAPTAVGAAMPATGFLKFREVSTAFVDNDVLSGSITATANGVDVVGWIEVVHDTAIAITVPRLGDFKVRGDWFALGTTTGAANQLVQVPTNGSANCYVPGVWIATTATPTTDEDWEFYPAMAAANMITANLGTDERSKFVCMETNGQIRIGHNGTVAVGYVPPASRQIRIPNVFGRQALAASRALNNFPSATPGTRPDFVTTSAGAIDVENFAADWYLIFAQAYSVKLHHVAVFDAVDISECASALDLYDGGTGASAAVDVIHMLLTSNFAGGTIEKWKSHRINAGSNDHAVSVLYCIGQTFTNCEAGIVTYARSSGDPFVFTQCSNITMNNCRNFNGRTNFVTSFDCTVNDHDHVDRYVGTTNSTSGTYVVTVSASSENIAVDGVTFGLGGTIVNVHPYFGLFSCTLSKNCKFRNVGTRASPVNGGSASAVGVLFNSGGNNQNIKVQRVYCWPTRTGALATVNSDKGNLYEHLYGDVADTMTLADLNNTVRNCGGTLNNTGQASVYGSHFFDAFTADTAGRIVLALNEPTAETLAYYTAVSGTPKFTSAGGLVLATVGDEVIFEMPHYVKGCTGLTNSAPVLNGTNITYGGAGPEWGNHDIYFQIDLNDGAGWNGSWLDLTAAALNSAGASISPANGFKLKIRIVCDTTNTTNLLTFIRINTDSTLAAQTDNLYPLDTTTVTFTGLPTGCDVVVLTAGTSTILAQADALGATSYNFTYEGTPTIDVGFLKPGYIPYYIRNLPLTLLASSIPVTLTADRNYL